MREFLKRKGYFEANQNTYKGSFILFFMAIKDKDKVWVEYEGKLENGEIFDSTKLHDNEPLEFIVGYGMLVSGFENAVLGMNIGEEKEVTLGPGDAYGERNPAYIQRLPKDKFPAESKEGMQIGIPTPMGQIPALISKVGEDFVELDLNHPLAGKTLIFRIKIVKFEEGPFDIPGFGHDCTCEGDHDCSCGEDCSCDEEHKCDSC